MLVVVLVAAAAAAAAAERPGNEDGGPPATPQHSISAHGRREFLRGLGAPSAPTPGRVCT